MATFLLVAWSPQAFAQNSNLSEHDRYIHNQSVQNTKYFNNADSYPKSSTDNYARFLAQQATRLQQASGPAFNPPPPTASPGQTRADYFRDLQHRSAAGDNDARIKLANCYYAGWGVNVDRAKAYALYREAGASNRHAEFVAGILLFDGDGVKANLVEARALIKHAAAGGDTDAINWRPLIERNLELAAKGDLPALADAGTQFVFGIGVEPDIARGVKAKQEAAARGDLTSIQNLAYWYRTPQAGVRPYDIIKSHAWLRKAAEAGDVDAMQALGTDYVLNQGIPVDIKEGLRWSQLAAEKGNAAAWENLGVIYNGGYPGIEADREKAAAYYRKAIAAGSATAGNNLARLFEGSDGATPDYKSAIAVRTSLAEKGDADSEMYIGVYYDQGLGVERDSAKGIAWYTKAAQHGSPRAMHELAGHFLDGNGVKEDDAKAVQHYRQAAVLGFPASLDSMGMFTFVGAFGVQQDELEGIRYFRLAGEKGDGDAGYNLGLIYSEGIGVDADEAEGLKWFKAGAEAGNKKCIKKLKDAGLWVQAEPATLGRAITLAPLPTALTLETVGGAVEKPDAAPAENIPAILLPAPWTVIVDTSKCTADQLAQARERILHAPLRKHNHIDYAYNMLAALYAKAKAVDATLTQTAWILAIHDQALAGDAEAGYLWGAARGARFGVKLGPDGEVEGYIRPLMTKGKPEAMRDYAVLYQSGKGVKKSPEKALALVTKAADAGLPSARSLLGEFLSQGLGTPKDPVAAAAAWKQAADAGDAVAQYYFGVGAATGDEMPKDEAVGIAYLKKAAEAGDDRAMLDYGIALKLGMCGLTKDLRTGLEYIDRAALAGNVSAQNIMGGQYAAGQGVAQDDTWACVYWEAAAKNGDSDAQFSFAKRKISGLGTPKNEEEAEQWLNEAAAQDNWDAVHFSDARAEAARAKEAAESPAPEVKP